MARPHSAIIFSPSGCKISPRRAADPRPWGSCRMGVFLLLVMMACLIFAVLLAISALTPSWHWVMGFIIVVGGALAYIWVQNLIAASAPGYKEDPGGLGTAIVGMWALAFVIASTIFSVCLILRHATALEHDPEK